MDEILWFPFFQMHISFSGQERFFTRMKRDFSRETHIDAIVDISIICGYLE